MVSPVIKPITIILFISFSLFGCKEPVTVIDPPPPPRHEIEVDGDVTFQGEISWSAGENSIDTHIWAENVGTDTARIETGHCAFNIIAYSADGEPVWYNRAIENAVCFDELMVFKIPTGETLPLTQQSYISGSRWYYPIPAGQWSFKVRAFTVDGDTLLFDLK